MKKPRSTGRVQKSKKRTRKGRSGMAAVLSPSGSATPVRPEPDPEAEHARKQQIAAYADNLRSRTQK